MTLREAVRADAPFLVDLWHDTLRRVDRHEQLGDLELVIKEAGASPEQRLVIAEYDGRPVGAVYLRLTTFSPLNLEPTVQALSPHVVASSRRKGVGRALMDAAIAFAEELGVGHVTTAAASSSRDGNRFLARLGFGPHATLRHASTPVVRARLAAQLPGSRRAAARRSQLGQVLAARRSMRRQQTAG
jgi:GNAT superfamily N-acetyltransferase